MRLTLLSVQEQAQSHGHSVEKTSKGYTVNGQNFRLLAEVVSYLNTCLETAVTPDLTLNETQQVAQQMGFLVQPMAKGYGIFFEGQLLGVAKLLREVMQVLPEYKEAIVRYNAELTTIEVTESSTVVYAEEAAIAAIVQDSFTASSVVMICGAGVYHALNQNEALEYIKQHHKQDTLPVAQPQPVDEQVVAQFELNIYIEEQSTAIAPQIQVVEKHGNEYVVANLDNGNHYVVCPNHPDIQQRCECVHSYYRGAKCKHQQAVGNYNAQCPIPNTHRLKQFQCVGVALVIGVLTVASWGAAWADEQCQNRGGDRREGEAKCEVATTKKPVVSKLAAKPKLPKKPVAKDEFVPPNNGSPDSKHGTGTRV